MTNEQYAILVQELRDDPLGVGYANMTDDEAAASLNEPRFRVPTTRFITWRAIAAVLDDDEYAAVKAALKRSVDQAIRRSGFHLHVHVMEDEEEDLSP